MASLMMSPCALRIIPAPVQEVRSPRSSRLAQANVGRIRTVVCAGGENATPGGQHSEPPKLEPFSQSRLSRSMRERSFLQKAEDALNEKCMALEGEEAYQCWEALFEYENIKEEAETECNIAQPQDRESACQPLERLENMVRQSGGVNSLIDNVRMVSKIKEAKKQHTAPNEAEWLKAVADSAKEEDDVSDRHPEFLQDGGIPKTPKELQEESDALLPESAFTRVLRKFGHWAGKD